MAYVALLDREHPMRQQAGVHRSDMKTADNWGRRMAPAAEAAESEIFNVLARTIEAGAREIVFVRTGLSHRMSISL